LAIHQDRAQPKTDDLIDQRPLSLTGLSELAAMGIYQERSTRVFYDVRLKGQEQFARQKKGKDVQVCDPDLIFFFVTEM
jgi:hypothetical protein